MRNEIMILDRIRCEKALQVDNFVPAWLKLLALLSLAYVPLLYGWLCILLYG